MVKLSGEGWWRVQELNLLFRGYEPREITVSLTRYFEGGSRPREEVRPGARVSASSKTSPFYHGFPKKENPVWSRGFLY